MMNKKLFTSICLIVLMLSGIQLSAQSLPNGDDQVLISGQVLNETNNTPVPGVTISNTTAGKATASDGIGEFSIQVNQSDTLLFTALGFHNFSLPVSDSLLAVVARQDFIEVMLKEKSYELESVNVIAYRDAEAFKKAIIEVQLPEEETRQPIKIPGSYDGPRKPPQPSGPISFITQKIGKNARFEKKLREIKENYQRDKVVNSKFNRDLIAELTGLQDKQLDDFMLYCELEDKFLLTSTEYDILVAINECYTEFQENSH